MGKKCMFFLLSVLLLILVTTVSLNAQSRKQLTVDELNTFTSNCGYLVKAKHNGGNKIIIVVGEYHRFADVQQDVECILKQLAATYANLDFVGKEGLNYDNGMVRSSQRPKLNLGIPLIGIEGESWRKDYGLINRIDDRHAELSKTKIEVGLTAEEQIEYKHVANQSYEIIVRKRSWEWIDNLKEFVEKNRKAVGLINTGFGHFYTMQERLDYYGISYMMILPNAVRNYVSCEAYWQKKKPNPRLSSKAVCDDQNIKPFWD